MMILRATFALSLSICLPAASWAQANDIDGDGDGFTPRSGDCDDTDNTVFPGATELCDGKDNDCDMVVDNPSDDDGDGLHECNGDCDDSDADRYQGNTEVCDGKDNDCSASTMDSTLTRSCYTGAAGTEGVGICEGGTESCTGTAWSGTCVGEVVPASEICDEVDNDCDGTTDEGFDADGDGFASCAGDCDDSDSDINPDANEVCDNVDNDCDSLVDERNAQGAPLRRSCYSGPSGTRNVGLCSDGTETCTNGTFGACTGQVTPATEICDTQDNDCDGATDEGFDEDMDGVASCDGDCDDMDPNRYPGNNETCDGQDNDCDAFVDERNNAGDPLRRSCYSGPSGTRNVGICEAGRETCSGGTFGSCVGEVLPGVEACDDLDNDCDGSVDEPFDVDMDGVTTCEGDCDDNDPANYPGNTEICDGQDNDCDTVIDETFDQDGDSFTTCAGDCDDDDNTIFPGAPEACNAVDDDCDGMVDEDFTDMDGDGFVNCGPNADCDDTDASINPNGNEICDNADNDCDGVVDERGNGQPLRRACYDGPAGTAGVGECNRGRQECSTGVWGTCNNQTLPDAEFCDQLDNDCDGATDEDFDNDNDGFTTCGPPADCDDTDAMRAPGLMETCDGKDNDCDDATDEAADGDPLTRACYTGPEGTEGVGQCARGTNACEGAMGFSMMCAGEVLPGDDVCDGIDNDCDGTIDETFDADGDGFTSCGGDCDDTDASVNPDALELCNAVDDDCDGNIDGNFTSCYEGPVGTATVGECRPGTAVCANGMPSGMCDGQILPVAEVCDGLDNDCDGRIDEDFDLDLDGVSSCGGDCDDTNAFVATGFPERCDCTDNDCNGDIDESPFGGSICRFGACHDFDGDGFTNCEGDCNDFNPQAFPGAPEICGDGIDNDCDGPIDEDVDEDADGVTTCGGDCDDRFAEIRPGAAELCDGFDNNCDGRIDEGFDQDNDFATVCVGDCDDNDPLRSPFRREICGNGIDDDCDGVIDPDDDFDEDGFPVCAGDCNDFNSSVYPGAEEVCDAADNDCNNRVDEGFDLDEDGFPTCLGDCDDANANINPFAREEIDMIDNNCNGEVDEGVEDEDGDGFSFLCGDCNELNPNIGPQSPDVCDGIDNDCDGRVDQDVLGRSTCVSCADLDEDGFEDCAGDCDDSDPEVNPQVREICDGKDNDCDGLIDLDRFTLEPLCTGLDAGPRTDAGVGSSSDAGSSDGDTDMGRPDGGVAPDDRFTDAEAEALAVECGCSTAEGRRQRLDLVSVGLGLLMVALIIVRRRRTVTGVMTLALAAATFACSGVNIDGEELESLLADASTDADLGGPDASSGPDLAPADMGAVDSGPLTEGRCRQAEPNRVEARELPGSRFQLAVHTSLEETEFMAEAGVALDGDEIRSFALSLPLDPGFDIDAFGVAGDALDALLDPLFNRELPGVSGIAAAVDESLRQTFVLRTHPAARTLRRIRMVNEVRPAQLRNGLASELARRGLADLELPRDQAEALTRDFIVSALAVVDRIDETVSFVVTVAPDGASDAALNILADLGNGTHVGDPGAQVGLVCEDEEAQALLVDFLWVVDNSASMQEEQEALSDAAVEFFDSLTASRIDFRLGVVTTDGEALRGGGFTSDLQSFRERVRVGVNGNGREAGLEFAVRAVQRAMTATAAEQRLRGDAVPVLIFYSDEDSTNFLPVLEYVDELDALGVLPFAIVGPEPRGCTAVGRGVARVGSSYIEATEALGGTSASICATDLTEPIREILIAAAGAASLTQLENQPISGSIEVQLPTSTVTRSRNDGFDFEPTSNSLLFFGDAFLPTGTPFRVSYERFVPFEN